MQRLEKTLKKNDLLQDKKSNLNRNQKEEKAWTVV